MSALVDRFGRERRPELGWPKRRTARGIRGVVIVADTSAILALLDRDNPLHSAVAEAFDSTSPEWVVPWAVLPEVDYLATKRFGRDAARGFFERIDAGHLTTEWGSRADVDRALELDRQYAAAVVGARRRRRDGHRGAPEGTGDRYSRPAGFRGGRARGQPRTLAQGSGL